MLGVVPTAILRMKMGTFLDLESGLAREAGMVVGWAMNGRVIMREGGSIGEYGGIPSEGVVGDTGASLFQLIPLLFVFSTCVITSFTSFRHRGSITAS